jgi:hypothetical protein
MLPHVRAAAQHLPLHRCCTRAGLETFRRSWSLLHGLWEEVSGSLSGSGLAVSLGGLVANALTYSAQVSIQPGPAVPAYLQASLVRTDGQPANNSYGLGQAFTIRVNVANNGGAGASSFISLTPFVSVAGSWASATLQSVSLVAVSGTGATYAPLDVPAGAFATYDLAFSVTQVAIVSGKAYTWRVSATFASQNLTQATDVTSNTVTSRLLHLEAWTGWSDQSQARALTIEAYVADQTR